MSSHVKPNSVLIKLPPLVSSILFVLIFGGSVEKYDLFNRKNGRVIIQSSVYGEVNARFLDIPYDAKSDIYDLGKKSIYNSYSKRARPTKASLTSYRLEEGHIEGIVILMHEGGFLIGSRNDLLMTTLSKSIAADGYLVASIDYPIGVRSSEADLRSVIQEGIIGIHKAIAHLEEKYSLERMNVYLVGASAGGVLALSSAFTDDGEYSRYLKDEMAGSTILRSISMYESLHSSKISGVISLWGGMLEFPVIDQSDPQNVLLIHGTKDSTVPIDHGYAFNSFGKHNTSWGRSTIPKIYGSRSLNRFDPIFNLIELENEGHSPYQFKFEKKSRFVFCPRISEQNNDLSLLIRSKINQWNNE